MEFTPDFLDLLLKTQEFWGNQGEALKCEAGGNAKAYSELERSGLGA